MMALLSYALKLAGTASTDASEVILASRTPLLCGVRDAPTSCPNRSSLSRAPAPAAILAGHAIAWACWNDQDKCRGEFVRH